MFASRGRYVGKSLQLQQKYQAQGSRSAHLSGGLVNHYQNGFHIPVGRMAQYFSAQPDNFTADALLKSGILPGIFQPLHNKGIFLPP